MLGLASSLKEDSLLKTAEFLAAENGD